MKSFLVDKELTFEKNFLNSFWAEKQYDILDNSIICFIGSIKGLKIPKSLEEQASEIKFLHFIIEQFNTTEREAFILQRLFAAQIVELLDHKFSRKGADIFYQDLPISISNLNINPVSCVFHLALDLFQIKNLKKLEKIFGISNSEVQIREFAINLMQKFTREMADLEKIYKDNILWIRFI